MLFIYRPEKWEHAHKPIDFVRDIWNSSTRLSRAIEFEQGQAMTKRIQPQFGDAKYAGLDG